MDSSLNLLAIKLLVTNLLEIINVDSGIAIKFNNGVLIYSLYKTFNTDSYYDFKIPFLDNSYSIIATHNASEHNSVYAAGIGAKIRTGFKVFTNPISTTKTITCGIIAIGKWK